MRHARLAICSVITLALLVDSLAAVEAAAADDTTAASDAAQREQFERRIRPLLVEHCFGCHGAEKQKGGLRLDSRAALLTGGDSGPAVVPGKPEEGYLVSAINYGDLYQMPPKGKLPQADIDALTTWVRQGAWWPAETASAASAKPTFEDDWPRRASHWSLQPVTKVAPPAVSNEAWCRGDIDRFILARIERAGLQPAPAADPAIWLRRATFALTGLPPTVAEATEFDPKSSDAYAAVVDRLLASPRFGERLARHWLDLARYAESYGHEYDFELPHAWRYRDYCIRAFNLDVPYDQLVREQIAGDLLDKPRRLADGSNESILGTSFFWLGEQFQAPVDLRQAEADRIDNQLDVMCKTFLGLTVSCARCHDHKFDPIRTADYYALFGILQSTRFVQADNTASAGNEKLTAALTELKEPLRHAVAAAVRPELEQLDRRLLDAAQKLLAPAQSTSGPAPGPDDWEWHFSEAREPVHPLFPWAAAIKNQQPDDAKALADVWHQFVRASQAPTYAQGDRVVDLGDTLPPGWSAHGLAFQAPAANVGELIVSNSESRPVIGVVSRPARHSASASKRLQGTLQSAAFVIDHDFIHVLASGWQTRIRLVIDGFQLIRNPIYGGLTQPVASDQPRWMTFNVKMWRGHRAYFEFCDLASKSPADPTPIPASSKIYGKEVPDDTDPENVFGTTGWMSVERVAFSDQARSPSTPTAIATLLGDAPPRSLEELARRYRQVALAALDAWSGASLGESAQARAQAELLDWLLGHSPAGRVDDAKAKARALWRQYRQREADLSAPQLAAVATEGTPVEPVVYIRGNPKNRGPAVQRQFLKILASDGAADTVTREIGSTSGRLYLANRIVDPRNPLTARVMVNRLWHWIYGAPLVPSTDDFGHMGQPATHPELLDYLAARFVEQGWSIKRLLREMALSSTFAMASAPRAEAKAKDPDNRLWHHVPARRLEAEEIRDALLVVSGRLDTKQFGPSVPLHLTAFMNGRGRPATSGPLDGNGRRSIYLAIRRNFLNPMFLAFDAPQPFSTVGRRSVSHVPAQALAMMNNALVLDQAGRWAAETLKAPGLDNAGRIERMYLAAFARSPSADELRMALVFVQADQRELGQADEQAAWRDLAHALLNTSEFLFVK